MIEKKFIVINSKAQFPYAVGPLQQGQLKCLLSSLVPFAQRHNAKEVTILFDNANTKENQELLFRQDLGDEIKDKLYSGKPFEHDGVAFKTIVGTSTIPEGQQLDVVVSIYLNSYGIVFLDESKDIVIKNLFACVIEDEDLPYFIHEKYCEYMNGDCFEELK